MAQIRDADTKFARGTRLGHSAVLAASGGLVSVSMHRSAARPACGSRGLRVVVLALLHVRRLLSVGIVPRETGVALILVMTAQLRATDSNLARSALESDTTVLTARGRLLILRAATRLVEVAPVSALDLDLTRRALTSEASVVATHLSRALSPGETGIALRFLSREFLKERADGARRRGGAHTGLGYLFLGSGRTHTTGAFLTGETSLARV